MDNNKGRMKDRPPSNPELRRMAGKEGANIGMVNGEKEGSRVSGEKFTKRSKLSHNK